MTKEALLGFGSWFSEYVFRFFTDDPAVNAVLQIKVNHTERVRREILYLGTELELSQNKLLLAETAALFHDLGRFKQFIRYRTFSDRHSENHALLSVRELALSRILSMLPASEKRLIARAISWHNRLRLPRQLNGHSLFYARLLRDADKLDIWRLITETLEGRSPDGDLSLGLSDEPVSSGPVMRALQTRGFVAIEEVRTFDDYKLLAIGWVYDLNFTPAFRRLIDRGYIERIAQTLPASDAIRTAVQEALEYARRCARSVKRTPTPIKPL